MEKNSVEGATVNDPWLKHTCIHFDIVLKKKIKRKKIISFTNNTAKMRYYLNDYELSYYIVSFATEKKESWRVKVSRK